MNIINRIKQIITSPKTEWEVINSENDSHVKVFTTYVALLALIPAIASFIGKGIIGYNVLGFHYGSIGLGIRHAIIQYITMVGGVYLTAFVIDLLASHFGSRKSFDKAFSLVAYAYTPTFVGGIFYFYHPLSFLASLASLFSLYLLYVGLAPIMKTPSEKKTPYFVVSFLVMIAAFIVLSLVLGAILITGAALNF